MAAINPCPGQHLLPTLGWGCRTHQTLGEPRAGPARSFFPDDPLLSPPSHPREMLALHPHPLLCKTPENSPPATCIVLKPTENPCEHQDFNPADQGLSRKPGAAHPQLGLRATLPNPGKQREVGGRERPFPASGTLNKPQETILPLSALQVTRGLIYSPARQMEKFPARVLDWVPAVAFWLGSCRQSCWGAACCSANPQKPCLSFRSPSEVDRRAVFSPFPFLLKAFKSFLHLRIKV